MQSRKAPPGLFSPLHVGLISRQGSGRCSSKTSINRVLSGKKNDVSIMTLLLRENNRTSLLLMSLLARISPCKVPLCVLLGWLVVLQWFSPSVIKWGVGVYWDVRKRRLSILQQVTKHRGASSPCFSQGVGSGLPIYKRISCVRERFCSQGRLPAEGVQLRRPNDTIPQSKITCSFSLKRWQCHI